MANRRQGLDEKIQKSAMEEFLQYGYKDASTNRIAKNAGVTSGAIYIRYPNKEEMFKSIVAPTIQELNAMVESYKGEFSKLPSDPAFEQHRTLEGKIIHQFIDFMYDNFDVFTLLICKSEGSGMSDFAKDLISFKYERTINFANRIIKSKEGEQGISPEELALLSSAEFHMLFEVIRRKYSREEAKKYLLTTQKVLYKGLIAALAKEGEG